MAKDAVDMATNDIEKLTSESITNKLPIIGADGYWALAQQVESLAGKYNLKQETITHLLNRYGSDISDIIELIEDDGNMLIICIENLFSSVNIFFSSKSLKLVSWIAYSIFIYFNFFMASILGYFLLPNTPSAKP